MKFSALINTKKDFSFAFTAICLLSLMLTISGFAKPLKVFILAGQSNMAGQGEIAGENTQGTLEYLVKNSPDKYGHLKDGQGNWVARDDVWIWCKRTNKAMSKYFGQLEGPVEVGQGKTDEDIGPELGFGHAIGEFYDEQVLLLKHAWGGTAVSQEWLSPGMEGYKQPGSIDDPGFYYQTMLEEVDEVLSDIKSWFPGYDESEGYEVLGMAWHQGWNDGANNDIASKYETNLDILIDDFRKDLELEGLPFIIGVSGHGGYGSQGGWIGTLQEYIIPAQLNLGDYEKYPEHEGNVVSVETREFWREAGESPGNSSSHYNLNSESYYLIGEAMGNAMGELVASDTTEVTHQVGFSPAGQAFRLGWSTKGEFKILGSTILNSGTLSLYRTDGERVTKMAIHRGEIEKSPRFMRSSVYIYSIESGGVLLVSGKVTTY